MRNLTCLIATVAMAAGAYADEPGGKHLTVTYSEAKGIGEEKGVMRRDPSDIIRVGDLYYVWYSKGAVSSGYDATVWYATSPDGRRWTEQGEALAKGAAGSWDEEACLPPTFLWLKGNTGFFSPAFPDR